MYHSVHKATVSPLFQHPRQFKIYGQQDVSREQCKGEYHLAPDRDYAADGPDSLIENIVKVPE